MAVAAPDRGPLARARARSAWLFLAPALIALALVAGWPLVSTVWLGLTDSRLDAGHTARFVGFDNYLSYGPDPAAWDSQAGGYFVLDEATGAALLYRPDTDAFYDWDSGAPVAGAVDRTRLFAWHGLLADPVWWRSVANTVGYTVVSVALELALGLAIALILNAHLPGRGLLRAAVLVPWAIPTVVSAQMWGWMLHDQVGIVNAVLLDLGLIAERVAWTAEPATALAAIIAVDVWKTTPFMALLLLAGLQMLPREIYEAARVDGVHPVRVFFRITLPLIAPALMVAVLFRTLDALRVFDLFYLLTSNSDEVLAMSVYARRQMIEFQDLGAGSAAATAVFAIAATATALIVLLGRIEPGRRR